MSYIVGNGKWWIKNFSNLKFLPHTVLPGPEQPRGPPSGDSADRDAYRRGPAGPGMEPKGGAGSNFNPEFVS